MKKLLNILKIVICVFFIPIILFNSILIIKSILFPKEVPSIFGYKSYIVNSGSMQTDIQSSEFVLAKDESNIKVNDIVVVKTSDKKATTYSVKNVNKEMLKLENDSKDYIDLSKNSIEGKVIYKSLFYGKLIVLLKNPIVIIFTFVITFLIGIAIYKVK